MRVTGSRPKPRIRTVLTGAACALLLAFAISVLTSTGRAAGPPPMARAFTLGQLGDPGRQITLAAYSGRPVIINFFASWCGPCRRETPLLASFYRDHHGQILIIGIDANDRSKAALRFVRAQGVGYPVAADRSAALTTSYGVVALPQTFFLNARHQIIRHVFGAVTAGELNSWAASLIGAG